MPRHSLYDVIENLDDVLALCQKNKVMPKDVCGNTLLDWVNTGVVGWDNGVQSYFFLIENEDTNNALAVGTDYREIPTYHHLTKSLSALFNGHKDLFTFSENIINTEEDKATKSIINEAKSGILKVDYYHQYDKYAGNIIWPIELGTSDTSHPVKSVGNGPIEKFRKLGYFASCFPEGDGITLTDESHQKSPQDVISDIRSCFGWDATLKNEDKLTVR